MRDGRVAYARTNDIGHAECVDQDAWLQESGRRPGAEGGNHRGGRVFRSPEERGRRRNERGRWLAFGEQSRGQGGSGGSVARGENSPHNAVREETPEQGVEDKEEGSERSDEEAGIEGANEAQTGGTGDAETEPAEAQAETSPVAVAELEAPPPGSRGSRRSLRGRAAHGELRTAGAGRARDEPSSVAGAKFTRQGKGGAVPLGGEGAAPRGRACGRVPAARRAPGAGRVERRRFAFGRTAAAARGEGARDGNSAAEVAHGDGQRGEDNQGRGGTRQAGAAKREERKAELWRKGQSGRGKLERACREHG
ncbi:unnamed protein product [Closterium sp. NIES-64]|nr:unnamed protein product [Closterium sp. NIES-64]